MDFNLLIKKNYFVKKLKKRFRFIKKIHKNFQ